MSTEIMQQQIYELNQKVDLLLEYINEQRQKRQVLDDLADDLYRIGNDAFKTAVKEFDDRGIELDMDQLKLLLFKFIRNIETFNTLLTMLESITDLAKDVSPILKEVIIDLTHEMERLENAGVFDSLKTILNNITNPQFLETIAHITTILANTKPDAKLDNKSLFKIMKEMRSPEVRRGLSYGLRIVKELSK